MEILIVKEVTDELVQAFSKLLPQLSNEISMLSIADLRAIVESKNTVLIVARENGIIGTLSLTISKIPSGNKLWIEDVVVAKEMRARGVGEQLVTFALKYAKEKGYSQVNLTSSANRVAAKKLYEKLGFIERDTKVYRYTID